MRFSVLIKLLLYLPLGLSLLGTGGFFCGKPDPRLVSMSKLTEAGNVAHRTPVWSPDGRWIVVNNGWTVYAVEANGNDIRDFSGEFSQRIADYHGYADLSPSLSPDGTRIAYATFKHGPEFNFDIATVSLDGSDYQRLTDSTATETNPVWSPGGAQIAFISTRIPDHLRDHPDAGHRSQRLYVMGSDGSDLRLISTPFRSARIEYPVWPQTPES